MLDVAKGYAAHEIEALTKVVELRQGMTVAEMTQANDRITEMFGGLNVVAENYPQLLSSENFKQLQLAVADAEEHLQASRRLYNGNVSAFNQMVVTFPTSIVANMLHFGQREFFKADEEKHGDVKMSF